MKCRALIFLLLLFPAMESFCQETPRWSISTNAFEWANLATVNASGQFSIARHFTLEASTRWNPWSYSNNNGDRFQSRQRTFAFGTRWWPWYAYSGWWAGLKGQYQEYNRGGLRSQETEEGDAAGLVVGGGFSFQINRWLNLDLGVGFWGGYTKYTTYACPVCGKTLDKGSKPFILPDEMMISAMFIF